MHDPCRRPKQWLAASVLLCILVVGTAFAVSANPQVQVDSQTEVRFVSSTRVVLFQPRLGQWAVAGFERARPGEEFYFNKQLYRVTAAGNAQVLFSCDTARLFEADRSIDKASRAPSAFDVVQILGNDTLPVGHALYSTVQPGATIRFQGKAYCISSEGIGTARSAAISLLQHIEITQSAWQHITDRHTITGSKNAGASIFNPGLDIKALIKDAEIITPVLESNGYVSREFDAGRSIGFQGQKQTSTYRVIATQSGKLVTAYPIVAVSGG